MHVIGKMDSVLFSDSSEKGTDWLYLQSLCKDKISNLPVKAVSFAANFGTVFLQECHKNEVLLSKLKSLQIS